MNKSVAAAAAIVVLLGLWMLSGLLPRSSDADESTASGNSGEVAEGSKDQAEQPLMRVQTIIVASSNMDREITLQGQLDPIRQLVIRAQTSGVVESIPGVRGSSVKTADPLVKLSLEGRDAQYAEAAAQLKSARSEQKAAKRLNKQGLQSQLALEQASARLASARSALTRLQIEIDNTSVTAPFDGILNDIQVEEGQLVERGTEIAEVIDNSKFMVAASATQQTVSTIKAGQSVTARLITGEELPGKITYLSAVADSQTRSFKIEAEIENPGGSLSGGVSASLVIPVERIAAVQISPSSLALGENGDIGIKAVNNENRVEFYPVTLISTDNSGAWVTGVPDGTQIITLGQAFVNIGDEVDPVPTPES